MVTWKEENEQRENYAKGIWTLNPPTDKGDKKMT